MITLSRIIELEAQGRLKAVVTTDGERFTFGCTTSTPHYPIACYASDGTWWHFNVSAIKTLIKKRERVGTEAEIRAAWVFSGSCVDSNGNGYTWTTMPTLDGYVAQLKAQKHTGEKS